MSEGMPIESVPKDGSVVLVWMEQPMMHSQVQPASFHPNVTIIGNAFGFDAPKATHWRPQLEGPKE